MQAGKRCAVYTRKSSEEGLEQDFNSLDAQREACLSYIASQKAEGWSATDGRYDDGGFSGGTMERPGLKKLLDDIEGGNINIIVVYKIDRLTRSLMDFAKLVEAFDRHNVTFVSVTQSFNTTTSMGRLTLNVLLSFAQFEREVTSERIRDKIAASKKKGIWMGGTRPTGYNAVNKQLVVNEEEARLVRLLFDKYLELGCVKNLKEWLDANGIVSKVWVSAKGSQHGGKPLSRGLLYKMLTNPVYIGKTAHKDKIYEGNHDPIIPQELWDSVQTKMQDGAPSKRRRRKQGQEGALLKGLLFDSAGTPYSPTYTGKDGKQYRYYLHQNKIQNRSMPAGIIERIPAHDMETLAHDTIVTSFKTMEKAAEVLGLDLIEDHETLTRIANQHTLMHGTSIITRTLLRMTVHPKTVTLSLRQHALRDFIHEKLGLALESLDQGLTHDITVPFEPIRSKRGFAIPPVTPNTDPLDLPPTKLKRLVQGFVWRDAHFKGATLQKIAEQEEISAAFVGKTIRDTF